MSRLELKIADADGVEKGELRTAKDVSVSAGLRRSAIITCTVNARTDRMVPYIEEHRTMLRAYLDGTLIANTWITACRDTGSQSQSRLQIAAADPLASRLGRRRRQEARTFTATDQGEIAMLLVDDENDRATTNLRTRSYASTTGVSRTLTTDIDKPIVEQIRDMADAFDGFDYGVLPVDEDLIMGDFVVWPRRGDNQANVFYEYGTGKGNIESYDITNEDRISSRPAVTGSNNTRATTTNTETENYYGTIFDSMDSYTDLTSTALLSVLSDRLSVWRSRPRQIIDFQPAATSRYLPTVDFDLGDTIQLNIDDGRWTGDNAITGSVRVYGWELTRTDAGQARVKKITISPNDQGGD